MWKNNGDNLFIFSNKNLYFALSISKYNVFMQKKTKLFFYLILCFIFAF